jgi:hypothetical protein
MNDYSNLPKWVTKQESEAIDNYLEKSADAKVRLAVMTKPDGSKVLVSCNWDKLSFFQKCKIVFDKKISLSFKDIAETVAEKKIQDTRFAAIIDTYNERKGKSIFTSGKVIDQNIVEQIRENKINRVSQTIIGGGGAEISTPAENEFSTEIRRKLAESGPEDVSKDDATFSKSLALRTQEKERLGTFLNEAKKCPPEENSFLYICGGAGGVAEQVYPGFIFDALSKGKQVQHVLFELPGWKMEDPRGMISCREAYINAVVPEDKRKEAIEACPDLSKYSVSQFLCGFPNEDWEQINKDLKAYMKEYLDKGGTIVIGDHRGEIMPASEDPIVKIYNDLREEYPNQIRFLWGHEGKNAVIQDPLDSEDGYTEVPEEWTTYEDLASCLPWQTTEA